MNLSENEDKNAEECIEVKKKKGVSDGNFCFLDTSPEYRLSKFERLTLHGGAELERAIGWLASKFGRLPYGDPTVDFRRKDFEKAAQFYTERRFREEPASFFRVPKTSPQISERKVHELPDGEVVDIVFPSQYEVQFSDQRSAFESITENRTVYTRLWRHRERPRCTVVAVHGWTMGDQRLNSLAFLPGMFYRHGIDVALIELPFHGRRKPSSAVRGEILFPSANVSRTNESLGQIISDLRVLKGYLAANTGGDVGVVGMSLGAYIAALWSSLDPLDFCIPLVPLVSMGEVAWEVLKQFESFSLFERGGVTCEQLQAIYAVHCPLSHSLQLPANRVLILAGLGDPIVPPDQPKRLWQHWGMPTLYWLQGGHVAQLKRSRGYKEIVQFLKGLGYLDGGDVGG